MATTAFCTVLRVTSEGRYRSALASICLVHEIPKTDVAGLSEVACRRRVKYEKSSVVLGAGEHDKTSGEMKLYA